MESGEIRKRRTRGHIIADLSINFVERVCLRAGYSVQRMVADYGIDLLITTHDRRGFVEEGWIPLQVKATDTLNVISEGREIAFVADRRDLNLWMKHLYPVILVIYDARNERGYWLNVKSYLDSVERQIRDYLTLRIPVANVLDLQAIRKLRMLKGKIVVEDKGSIHG